MKPPWEVEPETFADKFWITNSTEYRKSWRDWFVELTPAEQDAYKAVHIPPDICDGVFYDVFGKPPYDPQAMADQFRDSEGDLPAPWIAFPAIPMGSMGWRMGHGEDYWHVFDAYFKQLPPADRERVKLKYPEPKIVWKGRPWTGFYERKERNG